MRLEHEAAPVGVDQRVALAPLDLLARIVAAGATSLGRLDALAVDNRAARAGLASDPLAIGHDQRVIDLLKGGRRRGTWRTSDRSCPTVANRLAASAKGSQPASRRKCR